MSESLLIRSSYELIKVDLDEIEYIESMENYIKVHLTQDKPIWSLIPLKKIIEKLPAERFFRIHRRYIIAVDFIEKIMTKKVKLCSVELPVSDSYYKDLKSLIPC